MTVVQDGPETCEVAGGGGFVRLLVPLRVHRKTRRSAAILSRYHVDGFQGQDTSWSWLNRRSARVVFRIPAMFLQERARITVEVFRTSGQSGHETLWTQCYRAHWVDGQPQMEPMP